MVSHKCHKCTTNLLWHAAASSTNDDAVITNDAIADVATHDDVVNAVTYAANGQYSAALNDVITDGTANGTANGTAYGSAYGAAYGTANGTANGTAHATAYGTANGTTYGSANGIASRSLPINIASTAEYVRTTTPIRI